MADYTRPTINGRELGAVIRYGARWTGSPPDGSYSRVSNPERFEPLQTIADALIEHGRCQSQDLCGGGAFLSGRGRGDTTAALNPDSSPHQVAAAILDEAQRRGHSPYQTTAIRADALQDSNLSPNAVSPNRLWASCRPRHQPRRSPHSPPASPLCPVPAARRRRCRSVGPTDCTHDRSGIHIQAKH
jgi:hypothetical protein